MKHIPIHLIKTSTSVPWRLLLTALVNLLAVIVILHSAALGFETFVKMDPIKALCLMAGITLLMIIAVVSFIASVKPILMWRRSLRGGSRTYIEPSKN